MHRVEASPADAPATVATGSPPGRLGGDPSFGVKVRLTVSKANSCIKEDSIAGVSQYLALAGSSNHEG